MDLSPFEPDCGACAGLCCVIPEFAEGDRFPASKGACVACPNLDGFACGIHPERAARGYHGCISYTCHGAGQAVVRDIFQGRDWRGDDETLHGMAQVYHRLFRVQEARFMLETMAFAGLSEAREAERDQMLRAMDPGGPWTLRRLAEVERDCPRGAVDAWLTAGVPGD